MDMVVHSMLTKRRLERIKAVPINIPEIIQWLCRVSMILLILFPCTAVVPCGAVFSLPFLFMQVNPMSKEEDEQIRKWMDKTPAMALVKGGGAKPGTAGGKKGKGDKDKKGGKKKK